MTAFMLAHPWMTFIIAMTLILSFSGTSLVRITNVKRGDK